MAEKVVESGSPSAKKPKLSSQPLSVSASDGTGNGQGMTQEQATDGRGCSNMSYLNPGMGNADTLIAETSQQGSPQMGGQASLRGPQPGAMNKDDDLGVARNNPENPEQNMEKPGLDDESNTQQAAATQNRGGSLCPNIQCRSQSLLHACECDNANCSAPSCQTMKGFVRHHEGCERRVNGGCPSCKYLVALCCYHATDCQENQCPVPFCARIKQTLPQLQQRLDEIHRRRMQELMFMLWLAM
ncbi:histone acetyltransferase p300-like isoform X2 [Ahaetulla prasina]|uniref:histone acetyltransferase p300-like isoform X1 n=1 Tax=Ahaetulla prasina TaxID=499056 RepID=UPI00264A0258|nr:histone acetyltransferase p300-like isoform X1 [Ahaetulla prasina]XP_058042499.1 histone acetyltransferase p300-like isoform X2 [Ahaetulla prasina]